MKTKTTESTIHPTIEPITEAIKANSINLSRDVENEMETSEKTLTQQPTNEKKVRAIHVGHDGVNNQSIKARMPVTTRAPKKLNNTAKNLSPDIMSPFPNRIDLVIFKLR